MKVNSIVAVGDCSSGNIDVYADGIRATITLTPEQCARLGELGREFYLEHQAKFVEKVAEIPPSNRLEAPKVEPEYTSYESVPLPGENGEVPF